MTHGGDRAVVVGVDGSESSSRALEWAAREAALRGGSLRIVHVFPDVPPIGVGRDPEFRAGAQPILDAAADRVAALVDGAAAVQTAIIDGQPARALVEESRQASMLVVGSRGYGGFATLLLGSTAVQVTAHAACPVAVVPGDSVVIGGEASPVVVGVDASGGCAPAVEFAFARAAERGAGLVAMHVWDLPAAYGPYAAGQVLKTDSDRVIRDVRDRLETALASSRERYPEVAVELRVVRGHPVAVLGEVTARDTDVVVVGSRGHSALAGMVLGSVSQGVLRHAHGVVVVAR